MRLTVRLIVFSFLVFTYHDYSTEESLCTLPASAPGVIALVSFSEHPNSARWTRMLFVIRFVNNEDVDYELPSDY